jgi:subtilisin family serine protease
MKVIVILSLLAIATASKIRSLRSDAEIIPGSYLIKLKDDVDPDVFIANHISMRRNNGEVVTLKETVTNVWSATIKGFAAKLDDSELSQLDLDDNIDYIEPDQVARIYQTLTQTNADWGISRHSSRSSISSPYSYRYDTTRGSNGRVYVIDTGIRITHNQFGGRAINGVNYVTGESATDLNGHGTHCAGTVGGTTYGVAKMATLVAVKVLSSSGSGTLANVISGIDWSASNAASNSGRVNVLSLSLGSSSSSTVNAAVARARNAGSVVAVAAGNSNANACNYSPAGEPLAFTVGSTAVNDARSSFSNFGTCVDIFAGGTSITSAWYTSDTATSTISGTSMACPQVAGLAAYTGTLRGTTSAATIESLLTSQAVTNQITNVGTGSPNRLANNELAGN